MKWDNKKYTLVMAAVLCLLPIKTFTTKELFAKGLFESPSWLSPAITYGSYLATASIFSYSAWQKLQQYYSSDKPNVMAQSKQTKQIVITDTDFQKNILTLLDKQESIPQEILASIVTDTQISKGLIRQLKAYNNQLTTDVLKTEHNVSCNHTLDQITQGIKDSFKAING
ncbi:MAG: hypothetical protein WD055_02980 [Candidatus Dependentiae bacterium]